MRHLLTSLFIIFIFSLPNFQIQAQCHIDDWTALKALYDSTNGDNWTNRTGWNTIIDGQSNPPANCNLSSLYGVQLNASGRVNCIDLDGNGIVNCETDYSNGNNLNGPIPPEIGNLSNLTYLILYNDELIGSIPPELGNLSNLTYLDLSSNELTGNIPPELSNLSNLTLLDLRANELSGNIPPELGNLSNLTFLDLVFNQLTGSIPPEIGNLSNLTWLALAVNPLGGVIPPELGNLNNLQILDLEHNQLNGIIPLEIGNLGNLTGLGLGYNELSGTIPPEVWSLGNLTHLGLSSNQLSGSIPLEIENLSNLTKLYLSSNQLTGGIPAELGSLSNLTNLSLSSNELTGNIPIELSNLSQLQTLSLGSNQLSGTIPPEIGNLNNLTWLALGLNQLNGIIPPELSNLNNLEKLSLYSNQLSGTIPSELGSLSNLTDFWLNGNELVGNIPSLLGNLTNLTSWRLDDNKLNGIIPSELGNLTNLTYLNLSSNQLRGNIPPELGNLSNLTSLKLSSNELSGNIPPELGNLINLEWVLDLSNNQLSGIIPLEFSNLNNLVRLYLNSNKLNGIIPDFNSFSELHISDNYFTCDELSLNFNSNNQIADFEYSPQFFDEVESFIIDTSSTNNITLQQNQFPQTLNNPSYQWKKNGVSINNANTTNLMISNAQPIDAGVYTLHIADNCVPDIEFISEPHYVIYPGYDFYSQPVEYNEIMVEFDNPTTTQFYENELLYPNAGWVADTCNCNRELYLWKFLNTADAMAALLEIDQKKQTIRDRDNDVDGGFNNTINIGDANNGGVSHEVLSNMAGSYPDDVSIFLLDTGLDETGLTNTPYLMPNAPIDNCYSVNPASGYNYMGTTINNNYMDEQGHGTFGFRSITDELSQQPNNINVVPLKIFNENGEGNLFDLTCAIYHAIDHNADIINISAGYRGQPSGILEKAINAARVNGIFICTAAGNDATDIDVTPQYPAYFASQYHYEYDEFGEKTDSTRYDNVISIAAIDAQNNLVEFSNYGQQAVTLSAYGENIHSYGLGGNDEVWSGTSMSTFYVSRELALEIAANKNRGYQQIWSAFESNSLTFNAATVGKTRTAKHLDVTLEEYDVPCTGCNCNNKMSSKVATINSKFGRFAIDEFVNNYIKAEKSYISHRSRIHHILESKDARYDEVQQNFKAVKDMALKMLFQSFVGKSNTLITDEHIEQIDKFLVSLSKVIKNPNLRSDIENARKYLHVMNGKEVKDALITFDRAGLKGENDVFENIEQVEGDFTVQLVNAVGRDAYLTYQSSTNGKVHINLFDVEGKNMQQSYKQTITDGIYQYQLSKQSLSKGIYYIQVHFMADTGEPFNEVLKLSVVQ